MTKFEGGLAVACQTCGERYLWKPRRMLPLSGYYWSDLAPVERVDEPAFVCCRTCMTVVPKKDWLISQHDSPWLLPTLPAASHRDAERALSSRDSPFVNNFGGDAMLLRLYIFRRYPRGSLERSEHEAIEEGLIEYLWTRSELMSRFLLGEICRRSFRFAKAHEIFDELIFENSCRDYAHQQIEFCDKKSTARQILQPDTQRANSSKVIDANSHRLI